MRTVILIVTGIFAVSFGSSAIVNTYDVLRMLPMYAPGMWWSAARACAMTAVFVGMGWIVWRQPRSTPRTADVTPTTK
jgi:hypothetical protein